ncbi:response regulator [Heliorestis acidaminivorans]|uniref:Stage 0 sporulation protein A homolog n=1 Tax=Heliorestis acidaminivorans TaxID=553427 RepID=A0A6I0ESK1_9FIRM|nr:response regulator [Heliorestis acidaminivorans]KAB2951842.1 response regulator [Heliorestis acidaminivorans]
MVTSDERDKSEDKMILVVDDQQGVRSLLQIIFQEAGYKVMMASNGLQAVDIVEKYHPPIVLMDVRMPGLDGFQSMLRMVKVSPYIKVILMTAYTDESLVQRALHEGAVDCLTKPFDVYIVSERVEKLWQSILEERANREKDKTSA